MTCLYTTTGLQGRQPGTRENREASAFLKKLAEGMKKLVILLLLTCIKQQQYTLPLLCVQETDRAAIEASQIEIRERTAKQT